MKNKLLFLFMLCFAIGLNAQKTSKFGNNYIAEFFLENGTSIKGYFLGEVTNTHTIGELILSSRISAFQYATLDDEKKKKVDAKDVKKIVYYDGDEVAKIQEKIAVKIIERSGKLSDKTGTEFAYLLHDGKIKLYGYNSFMCQNGGCYYTHSNFYIKKSDDPYAVLAVKPKGQFNFKMGSSIENIVEAFREVGGKCPEFSKYLDFFDKKMMKEEQLDKKLQKDYQEIYKNTVKDVQQKKIASHVLFDAVAERVQEHQAEIFMGIISEYEKSCP